MTTITEHIRAEIAQHRTIIDRLEAALVALDGGAAPSDLAERRAEASDQATAIFAYLTEHSEAESWKIEEATGIPNQTVDNRLRALRSRKLTTRRKAGRSRDNSRAVWIHSLTAAGRRMAERGSEPRIRTRASRPPGTARTRVSTNDDDVLAIIDQEKQVTASTLAGHIGCSVSHARNVLNRLLKAGKLKKEVVNIEHGHAHLYSIN